MPGGLAWRLFSDNVTQTDFLSPLIRPLFQRKRHL
jgi:hypothetical protein